MAGIPLFGGLFSVNGVMSLLLILMIVVVIYLVILELEFRQQREVISELDDEEVKLSKEMRDLRKEIKELKEVVSMAKEQGSISGSDVGGNLEQE